MRPPARVGCVSKRRFVENTVNTTKGYGAMHACSILFATTSTFSHCGRIGRRRL
jgi:hypothetical protein